MSECYGRSRPSTGLVIIILVPISHFNQNAGENRVEERCNFPLSKHPLISVFIASSETVWGGVLLLFFASIWRPTTSPGRLRRHMLPAGSAARLVGLDDVDNGHFTTRAIPDLSLCVCALYSVCLSCWVSPAPPGGVLVHTVCSPRFFFLFSFFLLL